MIRTYPEFELGNLSVFGPAGSRHWNLVELCGRALHFLAVFTVDDSSSEDGSERRVIIPSISALCDFLAGYPSRCAAPQIFALRREASADTSAPSWELRKVTRVMVGIEPSATTLTAYALDFEDAPSTVLSAHSTPAHLLLDLAAVYECYGSLQPD